MLGGRLRGAAIDLSESERHRVLASDRRRTVLAVLGERRAPSDLRRLAEAVARREADDSTTPGDAERVAISLHHRHLPLLDDLGVVAYDPDARRVESDR